MENSVAAEVIAAFQEAGSQAQLGAVAAILVRPGAASQFASYLKSHGATKDAARLVDKCLQALRRGTVVISDASQPGAASHQPPAQDADAEAGEVLQRLRDGAIAALYRAAAGVMGGEGEDAELGGYPNVLLDHLDALGFQPLTLVLSDVCRGVEARSRGAPRLLALLPKAVGLLAAKGAPEDEAEDEAMEDNGGGGGGGGGRRGGAGAPSAAAQHTATALHRLTHAEWAPEHAVAIMEALREVKMTPQQQQAVITKALSVCGACSGSGSGGGGGGDLAALPALLRQLMRLAGPGNRAMVLRGVLNLFERLEAANRRAPAPGPGAGPGPSTSMGPPAAPAATGTGTGAGSGISGALAAVEGTALVTLADAFKYDAALAKDLIKLVESSPAAPSRFCLLLLFTLSQQHKQEGPVRSLLKHLVSAGFQWDATRAGSAWLSGLPALPRPGGQQLRAALLAAVRTSGVGGEVVVPGIVALGAALLGSCPPAEALALVQRNEAAAAAAAAGSSGGGCGAAAAAAAAGGGGGGGVPLPGRGSAGLQSALLGIELLQAAFEAHMEARGPVLRLCQEALGGTAGGGATAATAAGGGGGGEAALAAVLLLGNLVARCPALLYEHMPKLKDALQSFLLLPAPVALGLLLALWPLAAGDPHPHSGGRGPHHHHGRGRADLRDYAVMLLRKVMFAREAASRLVAVRGFLFILLQQLEAAAAAAGGGPGGAGGAAAGQDEDERLEAAAAAAAAAAGPSFSQASASQSCLSQMSALASGGGVSAQHELQGFLRRALGQQAGVRAALYGGLGQVLGADAGSRDIVMELVAPQLQRYLAPPPAMPPLNIRLLVSGGNSADGGGAVALVEPLPALLDAARKLVFLSREPGEGPAWLLQDEEGEQGAGGAIMVDEDEDGGGDAADDASVQALVRGWDSFARRLSRCHAEHFDLNTAAELNPGTPAGAARQLQAMCLLGAIEVVMQELVHVATGPGGSDSAAASGDRLQRLFELHCRVHELAREAKATPAGGGRGKNAAAATDAGGGGGDSAHAGSDGATTAVGVVGPGTAPAAAAGGNAGGGGLKRPRELLCPDLVPADARPPALGWGCLGRLCGGVQRDGLAHDMADEPGAGPSAHTRLARSPLFRAFVLRSCLNRLRAAAGSSSASSAAASSSGGALADALVACAQRRQARRAQRAEERSGAGGGSGGEGSGGASGGALEAPWRKMAQPLVLLCQMLLSTWTGPTKRPPAPRKAGGSGGPQAEAEARAVRREAAAADSLAGLAVGCLRELLGSAAALGGLGLVAWVLRGLPIHCQDTQAQVDESALPPAEVVGARLPHFADMLTALMGAGSFKEATALVEVVVGLARLLPPAAQLGVSEVLWERLHQTEPRVKYAPLVRALISAHVGLRGSEDAAALRAVALSVQAVIGAAGAATQEEPSAPGALHQDTGQFAALEVLQLLGQGLAQAEEALAAATRVATGGEGEAALGGAGAAAGAGGTGAGTGRGGRGGGGGGRPGSGAAASRVLVQLSEAVARRLVRLLDVLNVVVNTRLAFPQVLEAQTEVVIRAFKLLGALAKTYLPAKGAAAATAPAAPPISKTFQDLVAQVHRDLTPSVYTAMHDDVGVGAAGGAAAAGGAEGDEAGGGGGGGASKQSRAKAKRDSKAYSQLVFALEDFEKQLLALDKVFKSSGINLMKGAKRSTNRDFQFNSGGGGGGGGRRGDAAAAGGAGGDQADRYEGA
ncbi:hypothetical protein HXX76_003983 [Chlamydomonas incerta]|uniref:Uncharacterized protein n=1 Tax=Chlamydomonas incerta TaxID=51695 RepID=A0A835W9B2_CHLIN|nr:hypothetical protein HXX76_003983 [Chlamydomonas incerta]|eukprot:KAG2441131.1 hypothetical protein HXX76_003983 [Chlamydomonas incerta]